MQYHVTRTVERISDLRANSAAHVIGFVMGTIVGARLSYAQQQEYAIIPIINPDCPYGPSYAGWSGINEAGMVVGSVCNYWKGDAFWYYNGVMQVLSTPHRYDASGITCINNLGEMVGGFYNWPEDEWHPFFLSNRGRGLLEVLDTGVVQTQAMNDDGIVVGVNRDLSIDNSWRACCWINGQLRFLPRLPTWNSEEDFYSGANGINQAGDMVGFCDFEGFYAPVRWLAGRIEALWMPTGKTRGNAFTINDSGQIGGSIDFVGSIFDVSSTPVIWDTTFHVIYRLEFTSTGDPSGAVVGINNGGQAVGSFTTDDARYPWFAFVSENFQPLTPLVDRLPAFHRWYLSEARDINDAGQIIGQGYHSAYDDEHAFLMTPVYPSVTLESPTPGTAGTANTFRVTGLSPDEKVRFYYSNHSGGAVIPGCDLQVAALQLDDPRELGSAVADADGVAQITRFVPTSAAGKTALIQAAVVDRCIISNYVVETFE